MSLFIQNSDPIEKLSRASSISEIQSILKSLPEVELADGRASYRYFVGSRTFATYPDAQAKLIADNYLIAIKLKLTSAPIDIKILNTSSGYSVIELNWGTPIKELAPFNNPTTLYTQDASQNILKDFKILFDAGLVNEHGMSGTAHWHVTKDRSRIIIDNWDSLHDTTIPFELNLKESFFPVKKLVS